MKLFGPVNHLPGQLRKVRGPHRYVLAFDSLTLNLQFFPGRLGLRMLQVLQVLGVRVFLSLQGFRACNESCAHGPDSSEKISPVLAHGCFSCENPLSGGVRKALAFRGGYCPSGTTHPCTPEGVKKFERPPHPPSATAVASGTL